MVRRDFKNIAVFGIKQKINLTNIEIIILISIPMLKMLLNTNEAYPGVIFNRYRRKRPKVDARFFDSAQSHTRRSDASEKREETGVSTFGRFRLWTSFESSPVSVKGALNFIIKQGFLPGADFVKYRQSKKLRILDTQETLQNLFFRHDYDLKISILHNNRPT